MDRIKAGFVIAASPTITRWRMVKNCGGKCTLTLGTGIDLMSMVQKHKIYFNMGLERFKNVQQKDHQTALNEIKAGRKRSHWMWYIFPQIAGLGATETSRHYAIRDIKEATDYLMDEELSLRLTGMCKALLALETDDAHEIFGSPDDLKLRSSMTLFDAVPATFPVFGQVLDKFYGGKRDERTLDLLKSKP